MNGVKKNLSILLQHWPYDKRCWVLFVAGLLIPSLTIVIGNKWSLWTSDALDIVVAAYLLTPLYECMNHKKKCNLYAASFWGTIFWAVIAFFGCVVLPVLFRLAHYNIPRSIVVIAAISPAF